MSPNLNNKSSPTAPRKAKSAMNLDVPGTVTQLCVRRPGASASKLTLSLTAAGDAAWWCSGSRLVFGCSFASSRARTRLRHTGCTPPRRRVRSGGVASGGRGAVPQRAWARTLSESTTKLLRGRLVLWGPWTKNPQPSSMKAGASLPEQISQVTAAYSCGASKTGLSCPRRQ